VEIGDYLRVIRRRLWVLILVPVLAAGAVAAVVFLQPPRYRAVATVAAPALVGGSASNQYSGPSGVRVFVANFTAALTTPQVLARVAEQLHISEETAGDGLSAQPIQDSSLIEVTYVTTDRALAAPVPQAASSETIRFLFQSQVDLAKKSVATAERAVAETRKKIADYTKQTGIVNPQQTYELHQRDILQMQQRRLEAQARGETTTAATLAAAIEDAQTELAKLAPQVTAYQDLVRQEEQTQARRNDLQRGLEGLLAQSRAADPRSVVSVSDPEQLSRLAALVRQGGVAFGAGLFLAIALVVLLEILRRPSAAAAPAGDRFSIVGQIPWSRALQAGSATVLADQRLVRAGDDLLLKVAAGLGGRVRGVIIVTSPPGRHGKTVVSTMLSTLLGRTGSDVLLVGTHRDYPLDVRAPGGGNGHDLNRKLWTLGEDATQSWLTALWTLEHGQWSLPLWHDRKGGQLPAVRLTEILSEARDLFDVVIVDVPSYLGREALGTLTWVADGVLVVVSNLDGAASMPKSLQALLPGLSAPFVGVVLNRVRGGAPALVESSAQELPPPAEDSR
jgi:Mrp family chromosome partitioning ATPase/capsular polysaccharide biosynthesis protein